MRTGSSRRSVRLAATAATAAAAVGLAVLAGPATSVQPVQPVQSVPSAAVATSGTGAQVPQLRREGRWLVDRDGRVVLLHGFNLVWKLKPYVPPATAEGFTAADADWLAQHGFNGVRLGTLWAGLTPSAPGVGDPAYRAGWQRVMDLLSDRGIWMQLDAHQDQWHETYGGEGVPDRAMHRPPLLSLLGLLPPLNAPFPIGYWTPENSAVFDRFWANAHGGLDDWAAAWQVAARWWKDQPHLAGYDLINEPWMGLEWPLCFLAGCEGSYRNELQPAYEKATRAIRAIDPSNIVWWEPQQLAAGRQVPTYLRPMAGESQLGYSWHNYCQDVFLESQGLPLGNVENCTAFSRERTRTALDQAARMDAVPLLSEWGATDNLRAIEIDADVADEHLMGWTHWAYKQWRDPTTADDAQGMFADDADLTSVKAEKLRRLVRTYPQATAGTPQRLRFDAGTGAFEYRYAAAAAGTPASALPTEVFVSPLHYPRGYDVSVSGGTAERVDDTRLLVRATTPGSVVEVRVTAR